MAMSFQPMRARDAGAELAAVARLQMPFDIVGPRSLQEGRQLGERGIENVTATIASKPIEVLRRKELQRRAKSGAAWSLIRLRFF